MKKNYIIAVLLLIFGSLQINTFAQLQLAARSKYEFNNPAVPLLTDSTLFYFSGNHYQPFISRLQTDWDSVKADSIVQTEKLNNSFYVYKIEKEFNAIHQMTMRGDLRRSGNTSPWIKQTKFTYAYDTNGNNVYQTIYKGGGNNNNIWNPDDRLIRSYEDLLPNSTTDGLRPTYWNSATYNFATSSWDTKDSAVYGYIPNFDIVYGTQFRDNGNGLEFKNELTGFCAPPYSVTINYSNRVDFSTIGADSFLKTEIYYIGPYKDSIVEFEYDDNDSIWRIQGANYYEFYPNTLKFHTWRNYVFSLNTPTNLIYAQGNSTEFKIIGNTVDYRYPEHSIDGYGMYKVEKWITYRFPFLQPIPITIVTHNFDALENIYSITTDSLFYDANDKLILIKSNREIVNSNSFASKIDYTYTIDGQLKTEALTHFDTTANAYVYKWDAYLYTFYYSAQPNAVADISRNGDDIIVFPNPAKNILQIQFLPKNKDAIFTIYDMMGKTIMQCANIEILQNNVAKISIQHLQSGIYLLEIKTPTEKNVVPFTKE
jgi:hypothetical protein